MDMENELRQQFRELQQAVGEGRLKMRSIDSQLEQIRKADQRSKLVKSELEQLPEKTRMYQSQGRMFVLKPVDTIQKGIDQAVDERSKLITKLQDNKTYLENSLKEKEDNLRDFINQHIKLQPK